MSTPPVRNAQGPERSHVPGDTRDRPSDGLGLVRVAGTTRNQPMAGTGSVVGVGVNRAKRERGSSPLCGGVEGAEPPSSLDTMDITRPTQEECIRIPAYAELLEEPTKAHRTAKARHLRKLGRRARARLRMSGASEATVMDQGKWYDSRARGEEERIQRVLACGSEVIVISCQSCGANHERSQGCRARRYCLHCRGTIAAELRFKFLAARLDVVKQAGRVGLFNPWRKGGVYGDKFLTLTVPHLPCHTIVSRVDLVLGAWRVFLRLLNSWFKERAIGRVEWFRVFEWTPGEADEIGHPHLHVWLFAPYLPRPALVDFWRHALLANGCSSEHVIIDIRDMPDATRGARELIKYLTKDITANGEKLSPELYAQVIEALDGHRQTQASRGFMGRATKEPRRCNECDSPLPKRVRRKPRPPQEQA